MALLSVVSMSVAFLLPSAAPPQQLPVAFAGGHTRAACVRCCATEVEIPVPELKSEVSFDFVPLLTALQAGEFREADFLTRAALITIAGEAAVKRGYVYYTEAPKLPMQDMATLERLWRAYSDGKFGYAVQRKAFESKKVGGNFDKFFARIGWMHKDGALLRWLPEAKGDEFIYDLEKAPKGHLPLTSTLRGQQLLKGLLEHPAWDTEEFADVTF